MLNVISCKLARRHVRRGVADVSGDFVDCLPILLSIIGFYFLLILFPHFCSFWFHAVGLD